MNLNWTFEEEQLLSQAWNHLSKTEILETFPDRSWESIRKKASRLGLNNNRGDMSVAEQGMLSFLENRGYQLTRNDKFNSDREFIADSSRYRDGFSYKIGIVSDTHLCSKFQQLTHLKTIYRKFADEGITEVLHAGDIVEGERVYRGQEYSIFLHGADDQADYAVEHYPLESGITTYIVSGNHDLSFMKTSGLNIVKRICNTRDDFRFVGDYGGFLTLPGGFSVYLQHGEGGLSYSRSYKPQKIVEGFESGRKPKLHVCGHWHVSNVLPDYRNVISILPGCFQGQTDYLVRKGLRAEVGGFIIEYTMHGDDLVSSKIEWLPFRKPLERDY